MSTGGGGGNISDFIHVKGRMLHSFIIKRPHCTYPARWCASRTLPVVRPVRVRRRCTSTFCKRITCECTPTGGSRFFCPVARVSRVFLATNCGSVPLFRFPGDFEWVHSHTWQVTVDRQCVLRAFSRRFLVDQWYISVGLQHWASPSQENA